MTTKIVKIRPDRGCGTGCSASIAICFIVFVALAIAAIYIFFDAVKEIGRRATAVAIELIETPNRVVHALETIFQTKVVIEGRSVSFPRSQIGEFAILQTRIIVLTKYTRTFANQPATLIIRSSYEVKAGFDMSKMKPIVLGITGTVDDETLPKAKILSIGLVKDIPREVYFKSDNWFNQPNVDDLEKAYRENDAQAWIEAEACGITREADRLFLQRLEELMSLQNFLGNSVAPDKAQALESSK